MLIMPKTNIVVYKLTLYKIERHLKSKIVRLFLSLFIKSKSLMLLFFLFFEGTVINRTPKSEELHDIEKAKSQKLFDSQENSSDSEEKIIELTNKFNEKAKDFSSKFKDLVNKTKQLKELNKSIEETENSQIIDSINLSSSDAESNNLNNNDSTSNEITSEQTSSEITENINSMESIQTSHDSNINENDQNQQSMEEINDNNEEITSSDTQNNNDSQIKENDHQQIDETNSNSENDNTQEGTLISDENLLNDDEDEQNNNEDTDTGNDGTSHYTESSDDETLDDYAPPALDMDQEESSKEEVMSNEMDQSELLTEGITNSDIQDDDDSQINVPPGFEFNQDQNTQENNKQKEESSPSAESVTDKTEVTKQQVKPAKFRIISISKAELSGKGGDAIQVVLSTNISELVFARFGAESENIITGSKINETTCSFPVPRMQPGVYDLSISFNQKKWTEPERIIIIDEESKLPKLILGCFLICIMIFLAFTAKSLWAKGRRKRKLDRLKNKKASPLVSNNFPSNERSIHHRNRNIIDV